MTTKLVEVFVILSLLCWHTLVPRKAEMIFRNLKPTCSSSLLINPKIGWQQPVSSHVSLPSSSSPNNYRTSHLLAQRKLVAPLLFLLQSQIHSLLSSGVPHSIYRNHKLQRLFRLRLSLTLLRNSVTIQYTSVAPFIKWLVCSILFCSHSPHFTTIQCHTSDVQFQKPFPNSKVHILRCSNLLFWQRVK